MTTQRLNMVPPRVTRNLRGGGGALYAPTKSWGGPQKNNLGSGTWSVRGHTQYGSMVGRFVGHRHPFALFAAMLDHMPTGAQLVDAQTLTINDGQRTVVFEFDSGGGVAPGNVAVPFTAGDSAIQVAAAIVTAVLGCIQYGELDLDVGITGPGYVIVFFSHRSHPGMYGWGLRWTTTNGTLMPGVHGWGQYQTAGGRNAWDGWWFPIRWGMSRGFARREEPFIALHGRPA